MKLLRVVAVVFAVLVLVGVGLNGVSNEKAAAVASRFANKAAGTNEKPPVAETPGEAVETVVPTKETAPPIVILGNAVTAEESVTAKAAMRNDPHPHIYTCPDRRQYKATRMTDGRLAVESRISGKSVFSPDTLQYRIMTDEQFLELLRVRNCSCKDCHLGNLPPP